MTGGTSPEEPEESSFDRFRRADPARHAPVDLAALRAAVDRRIAADDGADGSGASDPSGPQAEEVPDDDATRTGVSGALGVVRGEVDDGASRAGRPSSPRGWMVAAAVATMLAVGTGGYIAGSQSTGSPVSLTESADDSADVSVQQDADPAPEHVAPTEPQDEQAQEAEAAPGDAEGRAELIPSPTGPVQFVDEGLPTETSPAEAWLLHAGTGERESLGQYPVISAADAVERLADPRFRAGPMPQLDPRQVPDDPPLLPLEPGQELPWPVPEIRLVDAELVTATYQVAGERLLLPTWHLLDADGQIWPVLALAEDALDLDGT